MTISTTSTISIISPAIITKETTSGSSFDSAALLPGFQVIEGNDKKLFVTVKDAKGHVLSVASRLFLVSYDTIACSISLKHQTQNRIAKRENKN